MASSANFFLSFSSGSLIVSKLHYFSLLALSRLMANTKDKCARIDDLMVSMYLVSFASLTMICQRSREEKEMALSLTRHGHCLFQLENWFAIY